MEEIENARKKEMEEMDKAHKKEMDEIDKKIEELKEERKKKEEQEQINQINFLATYTSTWYVKNRPAKTNIIKGSVDEWIDIIENSNDVELRKEAHKKLKNNWKKSE